MRILIFTGLLLASAAAPSLGANQTGTEQIIDAATLFLESFASRQKAEGYETDFELGSLDSRISLAPCTDGPTVEFSGDPWRSVSPRLLVSCEGERPWKLYLSTSLTLSGEVYVAARPMNRGDRINDAMIATATTVINSQRRKAIASRTHLLGMELQRPVNAGTVFTADLITAPDAVARGDHVTITARSENFSVKSRGKALANARLGEQVLVENLSSSRTLRARVTGPGLVEVRM